MSVNALPCGCLATWCCCRQRTAPVAALVKESDAEQGSPGWWHEGIDVKPFGYTSSHHQSLLPFVVPPQGGLAGKSAAMFEALFAEGDDKLPVALKARRALLAPLCADAAGQLATLLGLERLVGITVSSAMHQRDNISACFVFRLVMNVAWVAAGLRQLVGVTVSGWRHDCQFLSFGARWRARWLACRSH